MGNSYWFPLDNSGENAWRKIRALIMDWPAEMMFAGTLAMIKSEVHHGKEIFPFCSFESGFSVSKLSVPTDPLRVQ